MRPYAVAEDRYSSSHTAYHESASRAAEANRVTTRSPERDTKTSTEPSVSLAAAHITISDEAYRLYRENLAASVQSSPIVKSAQIAHPISSREYSSVNQSALHNSYASIKSEATKEDREMLRHVDTSGNEERTTSSHPTPVSVAENVGIGVFDGVKQTLGSLFHTVEHPVQTIKALGDAVSHPIETYKAMKQMAIGDIQKFKEADANQKARDIGEMVSDVGLAIVGTKGLSTVVNVISKGAEVTGAVADMATAVRDASEYEEQLEKAEINLHKPNSWYNEDGSINFPPNDGAIPGTEKIVELPIGTIVGRYGGTTDSSIYVTQAGTPPEKLSLPPTTDKTVYEEYKVTKPIPNTIQAEVAPWGDDPGGGTQYKLPEPIHMLIMKGYLKEIK